ncbi:hypothetical protein GGH95_000691 [Coemansia sp. RSA 1836]|nr:hypothetical protein GGH95_000691 [Coemansia sp. RSA 1836]
MPLFSRGRSADTAAIESGGGGSHQQQEKSFAGGLVTEVVVPRVSRPKLIVFYLGALVTMFAISLQTVVPTSFFVQAVEPWGVEVSSLWMPASYLIGYVALVLPAFRISEMTGRLATFCFGFGMFVTFTVLSGHASTAYKFSVLRAFQGVGAGFLASTILLVVSTNTSDRSRSLFVAGLCATQLFGVGAAHTIGGKLAIDGHFRWSVYLASPLMVVPGILCLPALFADKKPARTESIFTRIVRFDYIGALILMGTVIMMTTGLVFGGNEHKWSSATVICLIVFGVVGIVLFLAWERFGASRPLFNTQWLHERNLQISVVSTLFMAMVFFAHAVFVPILYITVRTELTDSAGRRTAPYWATSMGAALLAGLAVRYRPALARPLVWAGLAISIVFSGLYYTIEVKPTSLAKEQAFYALAGLGLGLAYPSVTYLSQVSVPLEEVGAASVVGHFLSIIGGMLGLILYQACLKSRLIINLDPIFQSNTFLSAFDVRTMDIAGLEMSGPTILGYVPALADTIGQKMVDSLHTTYILTVPFLAVSLLATLFYKHSHASSSI